MALHSPSLDEWIEEAKADPASDQVGMYLAHRGVVRGTARSQVREGQEEARPVVGMEFSYDGGKIKEARERALAMPGIHYVKIWLAYGRLDLGDDIMQILVGGDIRPNVVNCLETLLDFIKQECVEERELYQ